MIYEKDMDDDDLTQNRQYKNEKNELEFGTERRGGRRRKKRNRHQQRKRQRDRNRNDDDDINQHGKHPIYCFEHVHDLEDHMTYPSNPEDASINQRQFHLGTDWNDNRDEYEYEIKQQSGNNEELGNTAATNDDDTFCIPMDTNEEHAHTPKSADDAQYPDVPQNVQDSVDVNSNIEEKIKKIRGGKKKQQCYARRKRANNIDNTLQTNVNEKYMDIASCK